VRGRSPPLTAVPLCATGERAAGSSGALTYKFDWSLPNEALFNADTAMDGAFRICEDVVEGRYRDGSLFTPYSLSLSRGVCDDPPRRI
jgi:hypothetical protein